MLMESDQTDRRGYLPRPLDYVLLSYLACLQVSDQFLEATWQDMPLSLEAFKALGWRSVFLSEQQGKGGYGGCAYFNAQTLQLVIAHRGIVGWKSAIKSAIGMDEQLAGAEAFTHACLSKLKADKRLNASKRYEDVHLSFTGHGLGAWLAEISVSRFHESHAASAVTLESPGSLSQLEATSGMAAHHILGQEQDFTKLDITPFLTAPNLLNTLFEHVGNAYRIYPKIESLPEKASKLDKLKKWFSYTQEQHSLRNMLSIFSPETGWPLEYKQIKRWPRIEWSKLKGLSEDDPIATLLTCPQDFGASAAASLLKNLYTIYGILKNYANFHRFARGSEQIEPDVKTLSVEDQFKLACKLHYEVHEVALLQINCRAWPEAFNAFLRHFEKTRDTEEMKHALKRLPDALQDALMGYRMNKPRTWITLLDDKLDRYTFQSSLWQSLANFDSTPAMSDFMSRLKAKMPHMEYGEGHVNISLPALPWNVSVPSVVLSELELTLADTEPDLAMQKHIDNLDCYIEQDKLDVAQMRLADLLEMPTLAALNQVQVRQLLMHFQAVLPTLLSSQPLTQLNQHYIQPIKTHLLS